MKALRSNTCRYWSILKVTTIVLSVITFATASVSWNPIIERDSTLEQFVEMVSSRYEVPVPEGMYQLPMRREPVVQFLVNSIDSLQLTPMDKILAENLMSKYKGEKALLSRFSDKARVNLNLDVTGQLVLGREESSLYLIGKGLVNPALSGFLGGMSYNSEVDVWTEFQNANYWKSNGYQPYQGNPYNLLGGKDSSKIRASDMFRGGVSWDFGPSKWDFGVDHLKVGPSHKNPLFMNFSKSPVAFARVNLLFPWFSYTHGAGALQTLRTESRYLMYHRFEVPLAKQKIKVGFNESIVYGTTPDAKREKIVSKDPLEKQYYSLERTFQPTYLIPFLPFAFMEHFNGDLDNKQVSLDIDVKIPQNFNWYFEFFLDDMTSPVTLFSNNFHNKWAYTVGGAWYGNVNGKNLTVSTEYTRIMPWVYTHFRGSSHRYEHYGSSMGADLGPNSDMVWTNVDFQLNSVHKLNLSFSNKRRNHEQRGGSISDVFISKNTIDESRDSSGNTTLVQDSDTRKFLEGDVKSDQILSLGWQFRPAYLYDMSTVFEWSHEKGPALNLTGSFHF